MKAMRFSLLVAAAAGPLLLASCYDSKVPLSDPQDSQPDQRLAGVWRFQGSGGETNYYHIGTAGEGLPGAVMQVVQVQHTPDGRVQQGGLLVFPTTIGGKRYLNVAEATAERLRLLQEKGWTSGAVHSYLLLRYEIAGDTMTVQWIDGEAKRQAIEAGRIKGVVEKDGAHITDTAENLVKFITEAGDALYSQDALRLERVK